MLLIVDICDSDKHWETKVLQKNWLLLKCTKREQKEDEDTQFNRSRYCEPFAVDCIIYFLCCENT